MSRSAFEGRSAIVTGGGSGVGAALVRRLVAEGAHVVVGDVDEHAATATVATVHGPARQALAAVAADRPLLVTPFAARTAWRLGRLSPGLVTRAGTRFVAKQRRRQRTLS